MKIGVLNTAVPDPAARRRPVTDPVVQAMPLTDIAVGATVTCCCSPWPSRSPNDAAPWVPANCALPRIVIPQP